jgi:hypothetical protein
MGDHPAEDGTSAPKRASRTVTPEDFATATKRGSRTLDELLAKKRGSRPTDDLLHPSTMTSTLPKNNTSEPTGSEIPNPLQRLPGQQTTQNGSGADSSWMDSHPHEASSYQKSILERASSVVDSIFGKTPTDRPSITMDMERFSTSQNDRLQGLVSGRPNVLDVNQPNVDLRQSGSFSRHSHQSSPGTQTKALFSVAKPKLKATDMREIPWEEKFEMIVGACRGLAFLHERGYMHCDLKSPNFLVSDVRASLFTSCHRLSHLSSLCLSVSLSHTDEGCEVG